MVETATQCKCTKCPWVTHMNTLKMINFTVCALFQALKKHLALKITCLFDIEVQLHAGILCIVLWGLQIKETVRWVISKDPYVLRPLSWVSASALLFRGIKRVGTGNGTLFLSRATQALYFLPRFQDGLPLLINTCGLCHWGQDSSSILWAQLPHL